MTEKNPFFGATFAERKAARLDAGAPAPVAEPDTKVVDAEAEQVEDKAVAPKKTTRKRRTS